MLPDMINHIIIEYIGYDIDLLSGYWTDADLVFFNKNYKLDVNEYPEIDYTRFAKLININDQKYLHDGIHTARFGIDFNQPVTLPKNIHTARFRRNFNQPITIPENIHSVKFGRDFNQPITLPKNIHKVKFRHDFNQPIYVKIGFNINKIEWPIGEQLGQLIVYLD